MGKVTPLSRRVIKHCSPEAINRYFDFPNCTFLGGLSDQPFTAFYVWEKFFSEYGKDIKRFIEFGCDQGSTSVYFVLQCLNHDITYAGFDKNKKGTYENTPVKRLVKLSAKMRVGNGYKLKGDIENLVQSKGRSVIFTDCIDKVWEFENFAPMLKKGDILAIHDWDRAIFDDWVKTTLDAIQPFTLLYENERLELHTLTRFFLKE